MKQLEAPWPCPYMTGLFWSLSDHLSKTIWSLQTLEAEVRKGGGFPGEVGYSTRVTLRALRATTFHLCVCSVESICLQPHQQLLLCFFCLLFLWSKPQLKIGL